MTEYIERMTAISEACKGCSEEFSDEPCEPSECRLQQRLFAIPVADVVEVRHGEWVCVNESENVWMCDGKNGCGNEILLLEGTPNDNEWNYCPNCGAKMDGKGEGE